MGWAQGKAAILNEKDKQLVDLILSGVDRYEAFRQMYPEKCGSERTKKQISKSISDALNKPRVKEYKESLETNATNALNNAIKDKVITIVSGIMETEELMLFYSEIVRSEDETTSNRIKAADALTRVYGLDKKSVDINGSLEQDIIINITDDNE